MNRASLFATLTLIVSGTGAALAAEPPSGVPAAPSKEQREKMAAMHEQVAACLRSDKPIADCHKEAMKHHQQMMGMMGKDGCPMMDTKPSGKPAPQK
jgi:hypothetical protein